VELEQLLQICNEKFGCLSNVSESPMTLHSVATALGYGDWRAARQIFFSWESYPSSAKQFQCAARNALVSILLFWSIAMGRLVPNALSSDLKVNVKQFVDTVFIRGPISKSFKSIPLDSHGLGLDCVELSSSNQRFSYLYN